MTGEPRITVRILLLGLLLLASCRSGADDARAPVPAADRDVTVGSFDFAENELLAELYSLALERRGYI